MRRDERYPGQIDIAVKEVAGIMRRVVLLLALVLAASLASTGVAAAANRCTVSISPTVGEQTDTYRITVSGLTPDPGILEVRVDVRLLGGPRSGSIYFAFLIPNVDEFFIDHNSGDPNEPLAVGRYLVRVSTPHVNGAEGCHTVGQFRIVEFRKLRTTLALRRYRVFGLTWLTLELEAMPTITSKPAGLIDIDYLDDEEDDDPADRVGQRIR